MEIEKVPDIMKYFEYKHLPEHLQMVSKSFYVMADMVCRKIPASAERSAGLRKILEAKDCIVRASL